VGRVEHLSRALPLEALDASEEGVLILAVDNINIYIYI
jgi:hypothetical protein